MSFAGLDGNSLYNPLLHNRAVQLRIFLAFICFAGISGLWRTLCCLRFRRDETRLRYRSSKSMNDHRTVEQKLLPKGWNSLRGYKWKSVKVEYLHCLLQRILIFRMETCVSRAWKIGACAHVEEGDSSNFNLKLQRWNQVTEQLQGQKVLWYVTSISEQLLVDLAFGWFLCCENPKAKLSYSSVCLSVHIQHISFHLIVQGNGLSLWVIDADMWATQK